MRRPADEDLRRAGADPHASMCFASNEKGWHREPPPLFCWRSAYFVGRAAELVQAWRIRAASSAASDVFGTARRQVPLISSGFFGE